MGRRTETGLDRDAVVAAAFAVVAEAGLDGLSMRRLADRLAVQAPALYWHIGDKAELIGLMSHRIYGEALGAIRPCSDWRGWLIAFGRSLRRAMTAHRDGARICANGRPQDARSTDERAEAIARPLTLLGLARADALHVQASVISLVLGWSAFANNGPMHDFLDDMMDFDASFEIGLQALVRGYRVDGRTTD
ncbi:TetR/AcrR family transcriptional regulator C-terminal domain-containing protein [Sphingobium sp. HWE2-09]|uniref:TetR/AcrR family transcriptional regulator C-terminal domain-containing protein n=1 Tax=Sphingobium sp. HWE2-09 TaxID=3108390 RepID=UPI002DCE4B9D|nr:TetR/AcrR family transcriptional regulator C-terminal domain-containing protein [Sphingobium sp. HWE2-09]